MYDMFLFRHDKHTSGLLSVLNKFFVFFNFK